MFDELNNNNQQGSMNQGQVNLQPQPGLQPEPMVKDIFAETEKRAKPLVFERKETVLHELDSSETDDGHHDLQKVFFLIFIVLILILLGIGGVWAYRYFSGKLDKPETAIPENVLNEENVENVAPLNEEPAASESAEIPGTPVTPVPAENTGESEALPETPAAAGESTIPAVPEIEEPDPALDSDGDGLTDEEEWKLGTSVDNVDTDNDGLFDREEANVYKTNPRNPDSDADGFIDGDEVKGGYDPLGPGRLYDVK
jgi:hypothetical protein